MPNLEVGPGLQPWGRFHDWGRKSNLVAVSLASWDQRVLRTWCVIAWPCDLGQIPLRSRVYICIVNVGLFVVLVISLRGAILALQGPGMDPVTLNSNFFPYASISPPVKWVCSRSLSGPWT